MQYCQAAACGDTPKLKGIIRGGRKYHTSVRTASTGPNFTRMSIERTKQFAGSSFPELEGAVRESREEGFAIWAKGTIPDRVNVIL
jgi:hypothetical protein